MNLLLYEEVQQLTEMQKQRKLFTANKSNICYLILLRNGMLVNCGYYILSSQEDVSQYLAIHC